MVAILFLLFVYLYFISMICISISMEYRYKVNSRLVCIAITPILNTIFCIRKGIFTDIYKFIMD